MISHLRTSLALTLCLLLQACASNIERHPVPTELLADTSVLGIEHVRVKVAPVETTEQDAARIISQNMMKAAGSMTEAAKLYPNFLAISGGGAEGAFTAGILTGWTEAGTRPTFHIVSGVSTGALIAPFAFLGPDYDHVLRTLYTTTSTKNILDRVSIFKIRSTSALADTAPLQSILDREVNDDFLARIAAEYNRGRKLIVATTNLDSQTPVVWNMGAIAKSGKPEAAQLFRDVMLASASIPGVFPPVLIEVQAGGRTYDEMHVDGGVSKQVFAYPPGLDMGALAEAFGVKEDFTLYLIRNSKVLPENNPLAMKLTEIAAASASMLIRSQGNSNITETYNSTQRDGIEFRLAFIPEDFDEVATEPFDPNYMQKLFNLSFEQAKNGYPWSEKPPWYGGLSLDMD